MIELHRLYTPGIVPHKIGADPCLIFFQAVERQGKDASSRTESTNSRVPGRPPACNKLHPMPFIYKVACNVVTQFSI